ncbi:MAG: stage II sporulation protein M [Clostridiales bacterium]|nr:stage II sporulation protein M [Clostridiales bacterium]
MTDENYGFIKKCYIVLLVVLAFSAAAGGIYYVNKYNYSADIKSYLDSFLQSAGNGMNCRSIMVKAIKSNMLTFAVLLCAILFRFGGIVMCAELIRRGFITGFTSAAMMYIYGGKGLVMAVCQLPGMLLLIPAAAVFAAVNTALSLRHIQTEKKFIILYIFFAAAVAATFCAAAFCEGYLTTTFMKWLLTASA